MKNFLSSANHGFGHKILVVIGIIMYYNLKHIDVQSSSKPLRFFIEIEQRCSQWSPLLTGLIRDEYSIEGGNLWNLQNFLDQMYLTTRS